MNLIGIVLICWLVLGLGVLLGYFVRRSGRDTPGPDTRIQRALSAAEVAKDRPEVPPPPVPTPRPYYDQLRRNADQLTTELPAVRPLPGMPFPPPAANRPTPRPRTPVSTRPEAPTSGERSLLEMTVPELMAQVEAAATAHIPRLAGAPVLPDVPDRRVHAELPDGSSVVRYEKAGKWFHEGPGMPRRRITLGQAALLATSRGAVIHRGLPGGQMFEVRLRKAREENQT